MAHALIITTTSDAHALTAMLVIQDVITLGAAAVLWYQRTRVPGRHARGRTGNH